MKRPLLLLVALALVVAACSDDGDSAADTSAAASTTATEAPAPSTAVPTTEPTPTETSEPARDPDSTRPPRRERTPTTQAAVEAAPIPDPVAPTQGTATRYGVVGCSNTDQAVRGYTEISSKDLLTDGDLGGGSAVTWGDPGSRRYTLYWDLYDDRRPSNGYDGAWVQLCMRTGEHGSVFDVSEQNVVTHIVEQIHLRDPGIPVWVSPINFYTGGQVCSAIGEDGPAMAAMTADWAAANLPETSRGPDLGPLGPEHIGVRDDCHPGSTGELLLGEQLVEFVD